MISAWNLIGFAIWIIIAISLISMVISIRRQKRQALLHQDEKLVSRNRIVLFFQGLLILGAALAMVIITLRADISSHNVSVSRSYKPIVLDTNGRKSYYVNVYNSKNKSGGQYYTYLTKGEHYQVSSNDSTIISGANTVSLPTETYRSSGSRLNDLDRKYQRAWIETTTAKYKPNLLNGLGLRAGQRASRYVIIRVPNQSFIYYH